MALERKLATMGIASMLVSCLLATNCAERSSGLSTPGSSTSCVYPISISDYTWRVDTVAHYPSSVGGVWAFSDTDAYLMGYISEARAPFRVLDGLHWNGQDWDSRINGTSNEVGHYSNAIAGNAFEFVSVGYWSVGTEKAALGSFSNQTKKWTSQQFQIDGSLRDVWTNGEGQYMAVGDNGIALTRDGHGKEWSFVQAPTRHNLVKIAGISWHETYILGQKNVNGITYPQLWRYANGQWMKLLDDLDTTGTPIRLPSANHSINDVGVFRCIASDSLWIYLIGWESYRVSSRGLDLAGR